MEPYEPEVAAWEALAPPTVPDGRRRWRARAVLISALLLPVGVIAATLLAVFDQATAANVLLGVTAALLPLLAAVLTTELALADWLTPHELREGRAIGLHLLSSLGSSGRIGWAIWGAQILLVSVVGGLVVSGPVGTLTGPLMGGLLAALLLLSGILVGWLVLLPLGLIARIAIHRKRAAHELRPLVLALLLLGLLLLAIPAAWAGNTIVLLDYLRAVLGMPSDRTLPTAAAWVARCGLVMILAALPVSIALLRKVPGQEAAGELWRDAAMHTFDDPS